MEGVHEGHEGARKGLPGAEIWPDADQATARSRDLLGIKVLPGSAGVSPALVRPGRPRSQGTSPWTREPECGFSDSDVALRLILHCGIRHSVECPQDEIARF